MIKYIYKSTIATLSALGILAILTTYTHNIYIIISVLIAYTVMLVIIDTLSEKKREKEKGVPFNEYSELIDECNEKDIKIAELERDFANQVKATDLCEKKNRDLDEQNSRLHEEGMYYIDKCKELEDVPFSDPIHQCDRCGTDDVRETKCYYICNLCGRRMKKEE